MRRFTEMYRRLCASRGFMDKKIHSISPERWEKIVEIFQTAREKAPAERVAYLNEACGNDHVLRQEVETLLMEDASPDTFLDTPILAGKLLQPREELTGKEVSHYTILEKLGEGGMGVVYKAVDRNLDRFVVMKFLSPHVAGDAGIRERFIQEAKTASALDHPNICTIHSIEQADGGSLYIVMAYYEGATIEKMISQGPLPVEKSVDLAAQVSEGLVKAHSRGIVHRDIKPANVIVTSDGVAKILDFGIAKLEQGPNLTKPGMMAGTLYYMSPEQASGQQVDQRTDIWALGVVLYEMLAARSPFAAENSASVLYAILNKEPEPLGHIRSGVPPNLEHTLRRMLAKDLAARFQSMQEVLAALDDLKQQDAGSGVTQRVRQIRQAPSIAVMPFANLSQNPENDYFSDGLTDELINTLARVQGIRVVSRTTMFQFRGQIRDIREIGRKLGVRAVLEGSVRTAGNRVRISTQLINAEDGYQLWASRYDGQLEDVFSLQDEIAHKIVSTLTARFRLSGDGESQHRETANPKAYQLYLKGRHYLQLVTAEGLQAGIRFFQEALAEDPNYARAYAGLAGAYVFRIVWGFLRATEAIPQAKAAALEAIRLDNGLADAHASLGIIRALDDWNWAEARREIELAIELSPGDPQARATFANVCLLPHGAVEEALAEHRKCLELDPLAAPFHSQTAWDLLYLERYEEAVRSAEEGIALSPSFLGCYWVLSLAYLYLKDHIKAAAALARASAVFEHSTVTESLSGLVSAASGDFEAARAILARLEARAEAEYVAPCHIAWLAIALGEYDRAFSWLERAIEERDTMVLLLKVMPLYEPVRPDSRYRSLLARLRLAG